MREMVRDENLWSNGMGYCWRDAMRRDQMRCDEVRWYEMPCRRARFLSRVECLFGGCGLPVWFLYWNLSGSAPFESSWNDELDWHSGLDYISQKNEFRRDICKIWMHLAHRIFHFCSCKEFCQNSAVSMTKAPAWILGAAARPRSSRLYSWSPRRWSKSSEV